MEVPLKISRETLKKLYLILGGVHFYMPSSREIAVEQLLRDVQLSVTPWTAA